MSEERGSARVDIFIPSVTEEELDDLCEQIAELIYEWSPFENKDLVPALIAVRPFDWPDSDEELVITELNDYAQVIVPDAMQDELE